MSHTITYRAAPVSEGSEVAAPVTASLARDAAICSVIFAGTSLAWFGWGHQGGRLTGLLIVGSVLSLLTLAVCGRLVGSTPGIPTMAVSRRARLVWWGATIVEFVLIGLGFFFLRRADHPELLSTWALLVVGLHFLPLRAVFPLQAITVAAVGSVVVAGLAGWSHVAGAMPAPTVAGLGGGLVLLLAAGIATVEARR